MKTSPIRQRLQTFVSERTPPQWEDDEGVKSAISRQVRGYTYYLVDLALSHEHAEIIAEIYRRSECVSRITRIKTYFYIWARLPETAQEIQAKREKGRVKITNLAPERG